RRGGAADRDLLRRPRGRRRYAQRARRCGRLSRGVSALVEFRILGPLEVVDVDRSLPLGGSRQRALLACLLTRSNEVVSTDRLVDQLGGERPRKTAVNTVQYYVSQLRKTLGADRVVTRAPGYMIRIAPGELDLQRFEALLEQDSAAALREAL